MVMRFSFFISSDGVSLFGGPYGSGSLSDDVDDAEDGQAEEEDCQADHGDQDRK